MTPDHFIIAAYGTALVLIGALCLATWLAARRTRAQLATRDDV